MPGADELSKEVADLLFHETLKSAALAWDVTPQLLKGIGSFTNVTFSQVLDEFNENQALREMRGMEGEISTAEMTNIIKRFSEASSSILVGDADADDFDALLKDEGVLYAKMDKQDDNCKMYIFLTRQMEKVQTASRVLQARRGQVTELNPQLYFNSLAPDNVHVVEGLTAVEMELFRHYARESGLLFTAVSRAEGEMVVCNAEDVQKARQALLYTGWALTGANGAKVREQVVRRLAGRTAINIAAEDADKELFIVSQKNPSHFVHISAVDFEVYKNNKQVYGVSRDASDFYEQCVGACEGLAHPVVLSAEQFHAGISPEELEQAHTIDLFPSFHDDYIEIDQVNRLVNLVARKSGLDDEHNASWGLWDPSVSYSEFAAYENIMDEDEREARVFMFDHFKDAAFYSLNHHEAYEVDMKEKNVDYIIARAEQKRRLQEQEEDIELFEQEHEQDPQPEAVPLRPHKAPEQKVPEERKKPTIAQKVVVKAKKKAERDAKRQENR